MEKLSTTLKRTVECERLVLLNPLSEFPSALRLLSTSSSDNNSCSVKGEQAFWELDWSSSSLYEVQLSRFSQFKLNRHHQYAQMLHHRGTAMLKHTFVIPHVMSPA